MVKATESLVNVPLPALVMKFPMFQFVGALGALGAGGVVMPANETVAVPFLRTPPLASGPENTADVENATVVANADEPQIRRMRTNFFIRAFTSELS
jgi:hypothetical protein